jgi:hypothetical protein
MEAGRAFNAGKAPIIPDLHWARTSSGPDTMNIGAPMSGILSDCRSAAGSVMHLSPGKFVAPSQRVPRGSRVIRITFHAANRC